MNWCDNCKLTHQITIDKCLFCGGELKEIQQKKLNPIIYPKKEPKKEVKWKYLYRASVIILSLFSAGLNSYFWEVYKVYWFLIVIAGYIALIKIGEVYFKDFWNKKIGRFIMTHYMFLSGVMFTIDIILELNGLLSGVVIPAIRLISIMIIMAVSLYNNVFWSDDFGYVLVIALTNILALILLLVRDTITVWPTVVSNSIMLVVLGILLLFKPQKIKAEIIKKIHY